jgi:hypothetical protein
MSKIIEFDKQAKEKLNQLYEYLKSLDFGRLQGNLNWDDVSNIQNRIAQLGFTVYDDDLKPVNNLESIDENMGTWSLYYGFLQDTEFQALILLCLMKMK